MPGEAWTLLPRLAAPLPCPSSSPWFSEVRPLIYTSKKMIESCLIFQEDMLIPNPNAPYFPIKLIKPPAHMKTWPSVGPVIRGGGFPLMSPHTSASFPPCWLPEKLVNNGLGHSVRPWHWARLTGPHGDQTCSPDLSDREPACTDQASSTPTRGLWVSGLCV